MFERLRAILIKEFRQIFRDPRMKTVIFVTPLIEMMIFGYAATTDVKYIPTAVYDLDKTPQSREIIRDFIWSGYFEDEYYIQTDQQQSNLIDHAKVNVVIRINKGFAEDLLAKSSAKIQLIIDGTDSNTAGVILSYANSIVERYSREALQAKAAIFLETSGLFPQVDLRMRPWFNENLESRNFYIPGVIALIVTLTSLLLTSMAIVREKEIGTMEQLIVSPLRSYELILGKLIPFAIIAIVEMTFVATVAALWFQVPVRGSILLLFFCTVVYLMTSLGIGLFISTLSSTQQEAMLSTFLFFFPAILLSGFVFPIPNMPEKIQYLTYINPMRYYLTILRGIFLKGSDIFILWPQIFALLIIGAIILTSSSLRFHKRLG